MRDFNKQKKFGFDRGDRQMYKATCDECGRSCEVPFRPSGDKPVYCNDCFGDKRHGSSSTSQHIFSKPSPRPASDSRIDDIKRQLDALNSKVDRLLEMIKSPTPEMPPAQVVLVKPKKEAKVAKEEKPVKEVKKKTVKKKK